jgi:arylsulfatase A
MYSPLGRNGFPKEMSLEVKTMPLIQMYDLSKDIAETHNVDDEKSAVMKELTDLLTYYLRNGRSAAGKSQINDGPRNWKQLTWIEE